MCVAAKHATQKQIVANDALNYDLAILGLSETHIKGLAKYCKATRYV